MSDIQTVVEGANRLATDAHVLAGDASTIAVQAANVSAQLLQKPEVVGVDPFIFGITVFVLACFVGYYVVWRVTPALHTPLMAVTNAISGIIVVGAMIAVGAKGFGVSSVMGLVAVIIASINIFGGFIVTQRMLQMFKKK